MKFKNLAVLWLYVVEVALVRKNELFRIQLDKTKYYI